MKKAWISGLATCAVLLFATSAFAQDYTLGFTGPASFSGGEGDVVSGEYLCTLTQNNPDALGAQGWSIGCTAEGGEVTSATTDGTTTAEVFNGGFNKTGLALPENNGGVSGAVSAVVLCFGCPAVIPVEGVDNGSLLAVGVDWTIPAGGGTGNLVYRSGLVGQGQPVDLVLTENGQSADFVDEGLEVALNVVVTCCGKDYEVGFATARDGDIIDDSDTCNGIGAAQVAPGAAIYCQTVSNGGDGIQGWSIGVEAQGDIDVTEVTVDGTSAAPAPDGKFNGGFNKTGLANPDLSGGRRGAVSAVVLCFGCGATLEPTGTESILKVTVDGELGATGSLKYADGLVGEGQPVDNVLTVNGASAPICNLDSGIVELTLVQAGVGPFLRGDPNDDGKVNIADPIWIINELFRGGPATGCLIAADANADGEVDLADAMYIIGYRFLGGPVPPAPFPGCDIVDEAAAGGLTCATPQTNC